MGNEGNLMSGELGVSDAHLRVLTAGHQAAAGENTAASGVDAVRHTHGIVAFATANAAGCGR